MPQLEIRELSVTFRTQLGNIRAVENVDLSVSRGEIIGIAGESGSGKSTLGYSIMRILPESARVTGKVMLGDVNILALAETEMRKIRGRRVAMVFQGAMNSLNPLMRIEEQVAEPLIIHFGVNERDAVSRARELLEKVGIDSRRGRSYPHELSGGLKQRVAIASALAAEPDVLIADEPTTALDVMTQAQIVELLKTLREERKITLLMISHDVAMLSEMCDTLAIMYSGKTVETGPAETVIRAAAHPYTQGLIASIPVIGNGRRKTSSVAGDPPDPLNMPEGCRFRPRCPVAAQPCCSYDMRPMDLGGKHLAACLMAGGDSNA